MQKETYLKKEFTSKEVNRMRNLITGKVGDKTQTLGGYEKKTNVYSEGDIWEDGGKSWTIKRGIKQSVTKLDNLKKLVMLPICCPECKKPMKVNDIEKKMYGIHGTCFSCVLEKEQQIKNSGEWEDYESGKIKASRFTSLEDFESAIDSWFKDKDTFVTEAGDIESWTGGDKKKLYDQIKEEIKNLKK
jgi:hypothetical protein